MADDNLSAVRANPSAKWEALWPSRGCIPSNGIEHFGVESDTVSTSAIIAYYEIAIFDWQPFNR